MATKLPFAYRVRFVLLLPALVLYTLWRGLKDRSRRYVCQRLSFALPTRSQSFWIHSASVGELNTALPLIKELQNRYPDSSFVVTSNTATSAAVFQKQNIGNAVHCFLPLDNSGMVSRFLGAIKPRVAIIVETELWPNLFASLHKNRIPVVIVNARLSRRTLKVKQPWLRLAYKACLEDVSAVLARTEADAKGYLLLGANPDAVTTLGNLKFAPPDKPVSQYDSLLERPYILAASTHHDEELQLAAAWKDVDYRDRLLVIVPRHPHRGSIIAAQLDELGWQVTCRSSDKPVSDNTDIYIADTVGELTQFIAHAQWVFVGGSLIPRGGQNLLEPARAGKAILCGPFMDNFADETRIIVEAEGAIQLADPKQIVEKMTQLLDATLCDQIGKRAAIACLRNEDIAVRYADAIVKVVTENEKLLSS